MARKLPPDLESKLVTEGMASLERGRAVRRLDVVLSALVLAALLAALAAVFGISDGFVIAVTVATSSLCVIWAMMSVSASLNAQFDLLMTMIAYYAEREHSRPHRGVIKDSN